MASTDASLGHTGLLPRLAHVMKQSDIFLLAVVMSALPVESLAGQQQSKPGWPCAGVVDPSYVDLAEATGGSVLLFGPTELEGTAIEMAASSRHSDTVFRSTARLDDGIHEFHVPLDSTIESVHFSLTLQCLNVANIVRPTGEHASPGDEGVEYGRFEAVHLVTI